VADFSEGRFGGVYYPSMVCNLQMRFDEGLTPLGTPQSTDDLAKAGGGAPAVVPDPIILGIGKDNLTQVMGIVPRSCTVELPGYRQAGTFGCEFEFRDLPLDPRVIRAMAVQIHLDVVSASDWARGVTGDMSEGGRRSSILTPSDDNLLIRGVADEISTSWNDHGAVVHVEGRDLRGILLDARVSADGVSKLNTMQTIGIVVQDLLALHPQSAGFEVAVYPPEWPGGLVPILGNITEYTRVNKDAATGAKTQQGREGDGDKLSFWDVITKFCFLCGAVPYFVGKQLRIRPARSLYDAAGAEKRPFDPTFPYPFKGGQKRAVSPPDVTNPEQFGYRRMVFGRDVLEMKLERKLGGVKTPVVRCVSVDTSAKVRGAQRLLVAEYPLPGTAGRTTNIGPSGEAPMTEALNIPVAGVSSQARLAQIAQDIYEEIARGEMGGNITTKSLSSFGGSNEDADLLRLRPGDPVELRVWSAGFESFPPPVSELTNDASRSFEEAVQAVADRVGDAALARVLVAANRGQISQLQQTFRAHTVRFSWDKDSGIGVEFDFQNYIESRNGAAAGGGG
jgi:hypothetical protein